MNCDESEAIAVRSFCGTNQTTPSHSPFWTGSKCGSVGMVLLQNQSDDPFAHLFWTGSKCGGCMVLLRSQSDDPFADLFWRAWTVPLRSQSTIVLARDLTWLTDNRTVLSEI